MQTPGLAEIRSLHEKYAPNTEALDVVFTHCQIVWSIAKRLIPSAGREVDENLVRAGSLLHDIGVYRLLDASGRVDERGYVRHGLLGHDILAGEGFPEELCRFCSCHTGVGLTRQDIERQGLPLPAADYVAVTVEEQLVMYADKFHTKSTPPRFLTAASYARYVARFGPDKTAAFDNLRAMFGEPELTDLAAEHQHALV
ncbi:HD domain-containing protein [Streptomyces sp. NPDC058202]|uniref:HD domain-containing protein n=1 Tax=Streptomyces sp. NPDC058202 TaxID=3346380 RepID=UPI0036E2D202